MPNGYHAMALAACLWRGAPLLLGSLPAFIALERVLIAGLRDWERDEIRERQKEMGILHIGPEALRESSDAIIEWLGGTGQSMFRFTLTLTRLTLRKLRLQLAAGTDPGCLKMQEAARIINDISAAKDACALTIAEPMPRAAINLRNMLSGIALFKE